jgi:hypothetical protein
MVTALVVVSTVPVPKVFPEPSMNVIVIGPLALPVSAIGPTLTE